MNYRMLIRVIKKIKQAKVRKRLKKNMHRQWFQISQRK